MVPAESILNLESRPLFFTMSVKTPSAAGLLQMLPKHTKRTEKVLVSDSVEDAIDEASITKDLEEVILLVGNFL